MFGKQLSLVGHGGFRVECCFTTMVASQIEYYMNVSSRKKPVYYIWWHLFESWFLC